MVNKKWLSGITLLSLVVVSACGTSGGSDSATETMKPANGSASNPPAASEPVTIEFWYGLGGKLGENMQALIDKFNASQQEVIVKPVVQADYSETEKKLQAAIASGTVPAAVLSSNADWARKGYYAPLD